MPKTAGILTNGGDTPSLNAALYHIRDALGGIGYTRYTASTRATEAL